MLSVKVPFLFENRVGNVICGHRLCAINRSKKSQYIIFSCILNIFMLVSPGKIILPHNINKYLHTKSNKKMDVYILYTSFMLKICNSIYTFQCKLYNFTSNIDNDYTE